MTITRHWSRLKRNSVVPESMVTTSSDVSGGLGKERVYIISILSNYLNPHQYFRRSLFEIHPSNSTLDVGRSMLDVHLFKRSSF